MGNPFTWRRWVLLSGIAVLIFAVGLGVGMARWRGYRAGSPLRKDWVFERPPAEPLPAGDDRLRVFFIGNSFTYYSGGQWALTGELARSANEPRRPHFGQMALAYGTLDNIRESPVVVERVGEHTPTGESAWDIVVIQPHLYEPMGANRPHLRENVKTLDAMIRKAGARTMLFMIWMEQDKLVAAQSHVAEAIRDTASECDADPANVAANRRMLIAPVGVAWAAAAKERPALVLYAGDHAHPSPAGSYLTACVFYATLYGKSPEGLPAKLATLTSRTGDGVTLPPADAAFLQRIAWQAVTAEGPRAKATTRP